MHNHFKKMADTTLAQKKENQQALQEEPEELFFVRAMHGVAPLKGKGREIPSAAPPVQKSSISLKKNTFSDLLEKNIEFDLESTHEYSVGCIRGLDPKIFRKLKAGGFSLEAHLDRHGLSADQAQMALLDFMKEHYLQGKRCVLLIPGRGKNSPLGRSILRQGVQAWLTQYPLERIILAFCTAQPKHGGAGAFYVLLRSNKKGQGKILWDKMIFHEQD